MAKKPRKPKPLYNVSRKEGASDVWTFTVQKMNHDLDIEESYTVFYPTNNQSGAPTCDCFAGLMHKFCRHKELVDIFRADNAIGTTKLYCYDHKEWHS
jgi:hypothetical protein